jgi:hypothetical protein
MGALIGAKGFPAVFKARRCLGQKKVAEDTNDGKEL